MSGGPGATMATAGRVTLITGARVWPRCRPGSVTGFLWKRSDQQARSRCQASEQELLQQWAWDISSFQTVCCSGFYPESKKMQSHTHKITAQMNLTINQHGSINTEKSRITTTKSFPTCPKITRQITSKLLIKYKSKEQQQHNSQLNTVHPQLTTGIQSE